MAVPTPVSGIVVRNPLTGRDMDIFWNANPEPDVVGYNVYRNGAAETTQVVKLTPTPIALTQYRDTTATQKINTKYYYTVTAVNNLAEESPVQVPVTQVQEASSPTFYRLNEMVRRHNIALNKLAGEEVYYWVRRTFGPRCSCWDPSRGQSYNVHCTDCYGTSYQGGFVALGWVKAIIDPPSTLMRIADMGWLMDGRSSIFVANFPLMKNGDLIVRKNNKRYEVDDYKSYPWQGQITAQVSKLTEIEPRNYQVFGLPVTP